MQKQKEKITLKTTRIQKGTWRKRTGVFLLAMVLLWTSAGGVAYAKTVVHHHTGDPLTGGGCYQKPVYHTHKGSSEEGGECYENPVYHVHTGDEVNGDGCYGEEVYHTHEGTETEGGACYEPVYHKHSSSCYKEGEHNDSCPHHTEYHPYDCGTVHDWDGDGHGCDGFTAYDCGGHRYLACGKSGKIVSYKFICTVSEDTLVGYALNCGKTEEDLEFYELTCPKTENDIDYYETTCGREEGEEYHVPDPKPDPTPDNSGNDSGDSLGDSSGDDGQGDAEPEPTIAPTPVPTLEPTPVPTPEIIAEAEPVSTPVPVKTVVKPTAEKAESTPSPVATTTPTPTMAKKVVKEVKVSPVKAEPIDTVTEPVVIEKTNPLLTPAGKIISITSGTVILVFLAGWLLLYLRRSVRVYNDDGKGTMRYLGRAAVELTEEGYCINLTDKLVERAVTNRYGIRPDLFLIGKNSSWEVFIVKDGKKKAVYLEKEIRVTI